MAKQGRELGPPDLFIGQLWENLDGTFDAYNWYNQKYEGPFYSKKQAFSYYDSVNIGHPLRHL